MNREDIIRMAREAGGMFDHMMWLNRDLLPVFERFAALVAAAEREACAQIAEEPSATTYECTVACGGPAQTFTQRLPKDAHEIVKAIRARSQA